MHAKKLTISIKASSLKFIGEYLKVHGFKTRSQVIEKAIALLREQELESDSREAAEENEPLSELQVAEHLKEKD